MFFEGIESKPKPCQFRRLRGQPSIHFQWRSTTKVLMVEAGPLLPPSKLGTREQRHVFEGIESKPKPCQFKWLRTAFHSFSMEKHYKGLDGGSRTPTCTIKAGYNREQRRVFEGIESKFKLRHREFATNGSCVCLFHLWFQLQAHWLENLVSCRMIMYEWDKHQTVVALFRAARGCRCPC